MLTVTTPAVKTRLCKPADVQAELGTATSVDSFVDQATDIIRRYCDREFGQATYRETIAGHGDSFLMVSRVPLISVAQVLDEGGGAIVDYNVEDPDAGLLQREAGWLTGELVGWNIAPYFTPQRSFPRFTVDYTAGWKLPEDAPPVDPERALPGDLQRACIELAKLLYRQRGSDRSVQSKRVGDLGLQFRDLSRSDDGLLEAAGVLAEVRRYQRMAFR